MNQTVNRILHILGIAVAVVVPVLTAILTGLPATSKEAIIGAAVLGILSSLKGAFGTPDATATVTSASKGTADLLVTAGATPQKGDVVKIDPQTTRPGAGYPGKIGVLVFLVSAMLSSAALAQNPTAGHCLQTNTDGTCALVVQPDLIKPLLDLNLKTGKVAGGLEIAALGACYGFTYQPLAWYASGFDLCFNVTGSQTAPTLIYPSGTVHFLGYGSITVGPQCLDGTCQWHLLFGGNLALGFGAGTAAEQRAKASAGAGK